MTDLPLNDDWQRLEGVVRKMRSLANECHSLKHFVPWRADTLDKFGENWPIGTVKRIVINLGHSDDEDWCVSTDGVRASQMNGATAQDDAKAIAALHNSWIELCEALEAVMRTTGKPA